MSRDTRTGMHDGALIDLAAPDWRAIDLGSVAISLARMPRFLGHTLRPVSVLEHSIAVARIVPPRLRLAALLHDAHEALMGDITRPMRRLLAEKFWVSFEGIEKRIDVALAFRALALAPWFQLQTDRACWAYAVHLRDEIRSEHVALADDAMCETEMRLYTGWHGEPRGDGLPEPPAPDVLIEEWLQALEDLVHLRFGSTREPADPAKWWLQP